MRLPDFIIIGAMKAATSTLHEQLAAQDGLFMSTPKEPNFFSDDEIFTRGLDWYSGLFAGAPLGALCGESSTHYTKRPCHPETVDRMMDVLPDSVRFIYVMRHPIDRLISQYIHEWTERRISCSLDRALQRNPELIDYSLYGMQMRPYLAAFGQDRVLPVFFERLKAHPQHELEQIATFIGCSGAVSWRTKITPQNVSSARMRRSSVREALVDNPFVTGIRRRFVPKTVRDRIRSFWTIAERPQLSDESLHRLRAIFDDDLSEIGQWCGRPLNCDAFEEMAVSAETVREEAA